MADDLPQGTESTGARPPTAIVCVDDPRVPVLRSLFDRTGFVVVGEACRGIEAVRLVAEEYPDVVIIDLAYVGGLGMRIFPVLAAVAPECVVMALSPMDPSTSPRSKPGRIRWYPRGTSPGCAGCSPRWRTHGARGARSGSRFCPYHVGRASRTRGPRR